MRVGVFLRPASSKVDTANSDVALPDAAVVGRLKQELFEATERLVPFFESRRRHREAALSYARELQACIDALRVYLTRGDFALGVPASRVREVNNTLLAFKTEVGAIAREIFICSEGSRLRREPLLKEAG